MSKSILRLMATLVIAIGLMTGLVATAGAQDNNGNVSVDQSNTNTNDQDNDNDSDQTQTQSQIVDQDNDGTNALLVEGGNTNDCGQVVDAGAGDDANAVACESGDSYTKNGNTNQANSGENTNVQAQGQDNDTAQVNDNDTAQNNSADVSDLGGDDNSTDDDVTEIDGDGNTVIGEDVVILLIEALMAALLAQ